jgi:hypothetical protein
MLPIVAIVLALPAHGSENDCTYDQANQLQKLQGIAATKANSRLIEAPRQVIWTGNDRTKWTLTYGGCAHLGFSVTSSRTRARPSKQDEVLQTAVQMAEEFWDPIDAEELRAAIVGRTYERHTAGTATVISIPRQDYDVFEVEHKYGKQIEQITVRWSRSF